MKNLKKNPKRRLRIHQKREASFIKSRNSKTAAVILTFNLQEQPYNIYIPGQPSKTAVCKYQDRPMLCHNWYKYGCTKTRYRPKGVCRICGEDDHTIDKTNQYSNISRCVNCG